MILEDVLKNWLMMNAPIVNEMDLEDLIKMKNKYGSLNIDSYVHLWPKNMRTAESLCE